MNSNIIIAVIVGLAIVVGAYFAISTENSGLEPREVVTTPAPDKPVPGTSTPVAPKEEPSDAAKSAPSEGDKSK